MRKQVKVMPTAFAIPFDTREAGKKLLKAKHAYNKAWVSFAAEVLPLEGDQFWAVQAHLREQINSRLGHNKATAVKLAIDELFRLTLTGESETMVQPYTYMQAVAFSRGYETVGNAIGAKLTDVIEDLSDDGFSDFCDAVPLAGKKFYDDVMAGKFTTQDKVTQALKKLGKGWFDLIFNGENYIDMNLEEKAKKTMLAFIQRQLGESQHEED